MAGWRRTQRWTQQPSSPAVQSDRYPDAQVYVPSLRGQSQTLGLTPTANGRYAMSAFGEVARSASSFGEGFTAPYSGGTWAALVIIPTAFPSGSRYQASSGSSSNTVAVYDNSISLRANSGSRCSAAVTPERGEAVAFVGRSGAYRIVHRGVVYSGGGAYANLRFSEFCLGSNTNLALIARMPDWGDERLDDLLRITADPWGELFEARRIWVPMTGSDTSSLWLDASGSLRRAASGTRRMHQLPDGTLVASASPVAGARPMRLGADGRLLAS